MNDTGGDGPGPSREGAREFGRYTLLSVLARGGMGVVYLAEDRALGRRVALKLLAPELAEDPTFRARFLRESRLAAALDHPNIVPLYEAGEVGDELFLAMRYVEGSDLAAEIRANHRLDPDRAVAIMEQIASALDVAHEQGLVHRDVKPGNILLTRGSRPGSREHAYLADFGLTKRRSGTEQYTRAGELVGSLDYIAPEQIRGEAVDGRADQYSLACVLYHALTGATPFAAATDVSLLYAHLEVPPPSPSATGPVTPALDPVLARAMAKDALDRYETCEGFVEACRAALGVPRAAPPPAVSADSATVVVAAPAGPPAPPAAHAGPPAPPPAHLGPPAAPPAHLGPPAAPPAHLGPPAAPAESRRDSPAVAPQDGGGRRWPYLKVLTAVVVVGVVGLAAALLAQPTPRRDVDPVTSPSPGGVVAGTGVQASPLAAASRPSPPSAASPSSAPTAIVPTASPVRASPASNGSLARAAVIDSLPFATAVDTTGVAPDPEVGEPVCGGGTASVWYRYLAEESGSIEAELTDGTFNAVLAVYEGSSFEKFDEQVCSADPPSRNVRAVAGVFAGQTYYVMVAGEDGATGTAMLSVRRHTLQNDFFAYAAPIEALPFEVRLDTTRATPDREVAEPVCADGYASLWYRYVAESRGRIEAVLSNATFEGVVAIYEGTSLEELDEGACGADGSVATEVTAGDTYYVVVAGVDGDTGTATLRVRSP